MFEKLKKSKKFDLLMDLKKNGIFDKSVLNAIEIIDRSLFVDENLKQKSNLNIALPIDCGQTISQPLVVAHMTQSLNLNNKLRVLEVGTGSGYQSLILSKLSSKKTLSFTSLEPLISKGSLWKYKTLHHI